LNLSDAQVREMADLANLQLSEYEVRRISHDLGQILIHIDQLNELITVGIEAMAQVLYDADETATLRSDVPHTCLSNDEALANAPQRGAGYFKVPKVIER
jgi:aspartyl-tRNA(Asn)/glutamyl-tRNA(Gln) amidotransferase subunit C